MKTILVTGASSGIGRALAVQAARAGYAVYAVGRNVRALAALAGQIGEEGGTIATDVADISDPANAPGLIGRAVGAYGHIDVLVNNAGAAASGPIAMQNDEALRAQFGLHVIGPLALVREALPTLRASRGHVFMLGSGVARVPVPGMGAYPPSKAALRSATSILRRELAPLDVAVTYVDPGAVDTGFMTRAGMPGAPRDVLVSPEQVARKILLAIPTRPRSLNVMPLQTAAVALGEVFPAIAEAVLERNPQLIGAGPTLTAIDIQRDNNGRGEKIALPSARPLPLLEAAAAPSPAPETEPNPIHVAAAAARETVIVSAVEPPPPVVVASPQTFAEQLAEITPPTPPPAPHVTVSAVEPPPPVVVASTIAEPPPAVVIPEEHEFPPTRWQYEPPDAPADENLAVELPPAEAEAVAETRAAIETPAPPPLEAPVAQEPTPAELQEAEDAAIANDQAANHNIEPPMTTSSFDAALESLHRRMERANLSTDFVRGLLIPDSVIDVGEAAMRWAGMPNKHERSLTSEVCFALAEWGFLAPRADGRYRVLYAADAEPGR